MIDLKTLSCACGMAPTATDYRTATALGITVEEAHALGDLWENIMDGVLDDMPVIPFGSDETPGWDFLEGEKVKYERALKARTDQEGS